MALSLRLGYEMRLWGSATRRGYTVHITCHPRWMAAIMLMLYLSHSLECFFFLEQANAMLGYGTCHHNAEAALLVGSSQASLLREVRS